MHNCLVYFPDCELDGFEDIRRKYDPTFEAVQPHVTVVFPVPDVVAESSLVRGIFFTGLRALEKLFLLCDFFGKGCRKEKQLRLMLWISRFHV